MQEVIAVLIILSVASIAWMLGIFRRHQLHHISGIDERLGTIHFTVEYDVTSFRKTPKRKTLKAFYFDGEIYLDDGYMTPLMWESETLADQVQKVLHDLDLILVSDQNGGEYGSIS